MADSDNETQNPDNENSNQAGSNTDTGQGSENKKISASQPEPANDTPKEKKSEQSDSGQTNTAKEIPLTSAENKESPDQKSPQDEHSKSDKNEKVGSQMEGGQAKQNIQTPPKEIFFFHTQNPNFKITKQCQDCILGHGFKTVNLNDKKYGHHTLEQKCRAFPNISFAVFVLNGENFVYPKDKKPADARLRAPQDLVFELGFMLGKLGHQRVFILYQEQKSFILPTPYHYAIYTPLDTKELWKDELKTRLTQYLSSYEKQ